MSTDTSTRSLVKTISWRITGSGATFAISYLVLGDFSVSSTIAITQVTLNTILYYVHDRSWNKITWQKHF